MTQDEFGRSRTSATLMLGTGRLEEADLAALAGPAPPRLALAPQARADVAESAATVARHAVSGRRVYGINTGFGKLADTAIDGDRIRELQSRLVRSHACGVGEALPAPVLRLILALKAHSLARGLSGIRPETLEALIALYNADCLPVIPAQGSVGASGDLAPLAHLAQLLIGEGEAWIDGARRPGAEALAQAGLTPVTLEAKEGLALLNGTQVSTALALDGLRGIRRGAAAALVAGAMSTDAAMGSDTPFDPRIQAARGQPGQRRVARILAALMAGSEIRLSHRECDRIQDPYSLRCQPQIMGAVGDQIDHAAATLLAEANGVSDNPLVFAAADEILSGGNFHAQPVGFAADILAMACTETASLSERRVALLMEAGSSGLPPFLVAESGLNSGFMIAQVTAAALVAETRQRAAPASLDSIPTSAGQEDHVAMATHGARRLAPMAANLHRVVAIELMAAAQGLDFHAPRGSSVALMAAHGRLRALSPYLESDRALGAEIEAVAAAVAEGRFDWRCFVEAPTPAG